MAPRPARPRVPRFGIGEWYGRLLTALSPAERREFAAMQALPAKSREHIPCPFKGGACGKDGGVCSLQLYKEEGGAIIPEVGLAGQLRASCPSRFHEGQEAFRWAGEVLLKDREAILVPEVGFLESSRTTDNEGGEDVGRIDMVLVKHGPAGPVTPLDWCALEVQGVYFSGNNMGLEFEAIAKAQGSLIFPAATRRPDYRSSGPKRLMPQLQIKVPTLRRWGKKMAVVVDRPFFDSMGKMAKAKDLSLGEVVWFIVRFEEVPGEGRARLVKDDVYCTTLEDAVEGLTGGTPLTKDQFESRITDKIQRKG